MTNIVYKHKTITTQIWDASGNESFHFIVGQYVSSAHGIMLLYDVTKLNSFQNIEKWYDKVRSVAPPSQRMLLVGNKIDLIDERQVTYQQGKEFAEKMNIDFIEMSVKNSENVDEAFHLIISRIYRMMNPKPGFYSKDYPALTSSPACAAPSDNDSCLPSSSSQTTNTSESDQPNQSSQSGDICKSKLSNRQCCFLFSILESITCYINRFR